MAVQKILWRSGRILSPLHNAFKLTSVHHQKIMYSQNPSSKNKTEEDIDVDKPVPFSHSKASVFSSEEEYMKRVRTNRAEYEHIIVAASLVVFMVYFCILREESDWDIGIEDDIFSKVPDLEIVMLRNKQRSAGRPGSPSFTEADKRRLEELEKMRKENT